METVVVTRHETLVEYLVEEGIIDGTEVVLKHVEVDEVKGKNVIGILPLSLAAETSTITEVPLALPPEMRGKELTIEDIRKYAGDPVTYRVQKI
jgi:putative CRISPR-associated protein (TIGR02620 family)